MVRARRRMGAAGAWWIGLGVLAAAGCAGEDGPPGNAAPGIRAALDAAGDALAEGSAESAAVAAERYRAVLADAPASEEARYGLALAERAAGRPWAAMWHFTRVLADHPGHAGALRELALAAYVQGRNEAAAAYLERLAAVRAPDAEETAAYADVSTRLNHFARADSLLTDVLERTDGPPESVAALREARGLVRWRLGRLEEAEADYAAAAATGGRHTAALSRAGILTDLGRPAEAIAALPDLSPAGARAAGLGTQLATVRARARLRLQPPADLAGTETELEAAVAEAPGDVDAWHLLARVRRLRGDLDGARIAAAAHRDALALAEGMDAALAIKDLVQGAIAEEAGDGEAALAAYRRGRERDPSSVLLACALGGMLASLDRRDEAREVFAALRDQVGGPPGRAFVATGQELLRRGLPLAAARQFELAAARLPDDEEPVYFHALALLEAGDRSAAEAAAAPLEVARSR